MKKITFILLVVMGMWGYTHAQNTSSTLKETIKGNWKTEYYRWHIDSIPIKDIALVFTFEDSTCSYLSAQGTYAKYWLRHDTINIKTQPHTRNNNIRDNEIIYKFLIGSTSANNLTLIPVTENTKLLLEPYYIDTIQLAKIKKAFNWRIKRIGFFSSGCFGTCPAMYLEIDSTNNLFFKGIHYTENKGLYSGKLSQQTLEAIKSDINSIALDSLKRMYYARWTDDQTCGVRIKTVDTTYESGAYGYDKEPIELRILLHRLIELYKHVDLKKDSTVKDHFKWKEPH